MPREALALGRGLDEDAPRTLRGPGYLRLALPGTPVSVRHTVQDCARHCLALGIPDEVCGDLELVLAEAMNNIVEHAFAGRGDGVIGLSLQVGRDAISVSIRDDGRPMPRGRLPRGRAPCTHVPLDEMPEGGFGWSLIRGLAFDLSYSRCPGGNRMSFRIPIVWQSSGHPVPLGRGAEAIFPARR